MELKAVALGEILIFLIKERIANYDVKLVIGRRLQWRRGIYGCW
jgi:hypothetical protein|tara:strand:+ start:92 stop:223 length:132 start_codon:yes stop_codon:yes gene_type:complete